MNIKALHALAATSLLVSCASAPRPAPVTRLDALLVDYHQHLISPGFAPIVNGPERDGAALIRVLDEAGIQRAVVLSVGYSFADERKRLNNPDSLTRDQNDWTSAQVARHAPRLIGFCSANPLRDAALAELERCLGLPGMTGIKLHFGNAGVTLRDAAHLARIRQVFELAQRRRAAALVHLRARGGLNFGGEDGRLFLEHLVPAAPDIEIVVAHLGGSGPGYSPQSNEVMDVFAAAASQRDPRMANVYFDVATNITEETTDADLALIAGHMRAIGIGRILYGSDLNPPGGSVRRGWEIFRSRIPLTAAEIQQIASNRTRFAS